MSSYSAASSRRSGTFLKVLTVIKFLLSLTSFALCIAAAVFLARGNLFGLFLVFVTFFTAAAAYLLSLCCLLLNFFGTRLWNAGWTAASVVSVIAAVLVITLPSPIPTVWLTLGCLAVQCVPSVMEFAQWEKGRRAPAAP